MNTPTLQRLSRPALRALHGAESPLVAHQTTYAARTFILATTSGQPQHITPRRWRSRQFSTSNPAQSRIGSAAITIPKEVKLDIFDLPQIAKGGVARGTEMPKVGVEVQGPLGTLRISIPSFSTINYDESSRKVTFAVADTTDKKQRAMWGTIRALFNNTVLGVSEGHICILRMVGVGFRATIDDVKTSSLTGLQPEFEGQQFVNLKVGYAHPIELPLPAGIKASTPQPTMILLEGIDKQRVKQFAAEIREWRKPEPYKGKGIFIDDETIRMKAKKIK